MPSLSGNKSNDAKHLAILARVVPRFVAKVRASRLPDYDARGDAQRLLLQLEACLNGSHPFNIPLPKAEIDSLIEALREHLL